MATHAKMLLVVVPVTWVSVVVCPALDCKKCGCWPPIGCVFLRLIVPFLFLSTHIIVVSIIHFYLPSSLGIVSSTILLTYGLLIVIWVCKHDRVDIRPLHRD